MIQHFDNLHTPLRSVHQYPQLSDQKDRFRHLGWCCVRVHSLWQLWNDPSFLDAEQRLALNEFEPFDEWEDFALFASHYFLLEASNVVTANDEVGNGNSVLQRFPENQPTFKLGRRPSGSGEYTLHTVPIDNPAVRRFGATFCISPGVFGHHGGLGSQHRVSTTNIYQHDEVPYDLSALPPSIIEARMCHTITSLGNGRFLLVGGRTSPDRALSDCWLGRDNTWERVDDLPRPFYRHCATVINCCHEEVAVLVFGGKTNSKDALGSWILWRHSTGWIPVPTVGGTLPPRFGAAILSTSSLRGILFGGMAADGIVCQDMWQWELSEINADPSIRLIECTESWASAINNLNLLFRVGACVAQSSIGVLVIGGITNKVLSDHFACICIPWCLIRGEEAATSNLQPFAIEFDDKVDRPLLVGHSVSEHCGSVLLVGGGSNCFSFGTHWNKSLCVLQAGTSEFLRWRLDNRHENMSSESSHEQGRDLRNGSDAQVPSAGNFCKGTVVHTYVDSARDFGRIVNNAKPVKIQGMDLGPCLKTWSFSALKTKIGNDRIVGTSLHA